MWRIWIVEVFPERGNTTLRVFPDCGAYDDACEFARLVRHEANSRNKAVRVEVWEMTGEGKAIPPRRINWRRR